MVTSVRPEVWAHVGEEPGGTLPAYAWPGGYPMYYIDAEGNVLCPSCANLNDDYPADIVAADVNWEDDTMHCEQCSARIESAYGE